MGLDVLDRYIACGSESNEVNFFNYNFEDLYYKVILTVSDCLLKA